MQGMGKTKRVARIPLPTLRAWRENLGLSRQEVADRMALISPDQPQVDQATIAKWESGETALRVQDLLLLAEIYGATAGKLLCDPGDLGAAEFTSQAHRILGTKRPEALAAWLTIGELLPDAERPHRSG